MLWRKASADIVRVRTAAIQKNSQTCFRHKSHPKTYEQTNKWNWCYKLFFFVFLSGNMNNYVNMQLNMPQAQLGSAVALPLGFTLKRRCTTSSQDNTSTVQLSPCFSEEDLMPPSEHWVTGFCLWAFVFLFNSSVWRDQYSLLDRGPGSTQPWIFTLHKWDEIHCRFNSYFSASAKD